MYTWRVKDSVHAKVNKTYIHFCIHFQFSRKKWNFENLFLNFTETVRPLPSHMKKIQKLQLQKQSLLGKTNRDRDITLTPRDFNYDNHHYKYLKYTKRAKVTIKTNNNYYSSHLKNILFNGGKLWSSYRYTMLSKQGK